jgi:hypothetical protein
MRSAQWAGDGVESAAVDSTDRCYQHRSPPAQAAACGAPPAIGQCSLWHSMMPSRSFYPVRPNFGTKRANRTPNAYRSNIVSERAMPYRQLSKTCPERQLRTTPCASGPVSGPRSSQGATSLKYLLAIFRHESTRGQAQLFHPVAEPSIPYLSIHRCFAATRAESPTVRLRWRRCRQQTKAPPVSRRGMMDLSRL